ncbi:MAG: NAD(P)H-dependent oxidoreductase subunit E [Firmicutes bacterium]|nr:NAD(P)H-dependent oxidoreductase subunit E [Bacillota bacterium]MDY5531425.1 NAD(P)H-dependent oxidoreductase subunit E [Pumilibacteraceae bacterium]
MVVVKVCMGSSCFLKGAYDIADMLEKNVKEAKLEDEVILVGSFCAGKCNRVGVTVTVDDDVYSGITKENFSKLWNENILPRVGADNAQ